MESKARSRLCFDVRLTGKPLHTFPDALLSGLPAATGEEWPPARRHYFLRPNTMSSHMLKNVFC